MGQIVEMGGYDVHWLQAHVWSEVTRYGLQLEESPPAAWASWYVHGERQVGTVEDLESLMRAGGEPLCAEAGEVFERPHDPFYNEEAVAARDGISVMQRLQELGLSEAQVAVSDAWWSTAFQAPCTEGALTQALRWLALSGWDIGLCFDVCSRYRIAGGINRLSEAIALASGAQIHFERPVAKIEQNRDAISVTMRDGEVIGSDAVVVTTPLNALSGIEFRPSLSAGKQAAAQEGQVSRGVKVLALLGDEAEPFLALGTPDNPLTLVQFQANVDGRCLVAGFGPDAKALDLEDHSQVEYAIHKLVPDVDVVQSAGHDWLADEFSRETWPMLGPNQLTTYLRELQRPDGRVVLAGSDYASGWAGFIDGAIESGIRASSAVQKLLGATR
jgi:hypothetical protein